MNYLDQNKVQAAINSAMPEYIALKEAASAPGANLKQQIEQTRQDDEEIIPSDPARLGEYYDSQGVLTFESALVNMRTGEVKHSVVVVDANHCRDIELQGLRDHQRVLRLDLENSIFRVGMSSNFKKIEGLRAEVESLKVEKKAALFGGLLLGCISGIGMTCAAWLTIGYFKCWFGH